MYMIHSRSYRFFTLIIAIFDYKFNIQNFTFIPMPTRRKTMNRLSTTASSKPYKAFQNHAQ